MEKTSKYHQQTGTVWGIYKRPQNHSSIIKLKRVLKPKLEELHFPTQILKKKYYLMKHTVFYPIGLRPVQYRTTEAKVFRFCFKKNFLFKVSKVFFGSKITIVQLLAFNFSLRMLSTTLVTAPTAKCLDSKPNCFANRVKTSARDPLRFLHITYSKTLLNNAWIEMGR